MIWKAIPSESPNVPRCRQPCARAEQARRLEELSGLQAATLQVRLDGRIRIVRLAALHRLAAREAERGVREQRDRVRVPCHRQLVERPGEQVVAGRPRGGRAVGRPGRGAAAAELGAVDQVVVDERGHVHELDRDPRGHGRRSSGRRGEEDEQRPEPLAARVQRIARGGGNDPSVRADGLLQPLLELLEVEVEPGRVPDRRQRAGHVASPMWSATIPPAKVRYETSAKPAEPIRSASSSGPGKRRTLAGR